MDTDQNTNQNVARSGAQLERCEETNKIERWKDIPGYERIYQASDMGRIKSLPRMCGKFHREPGKILVPVPKRNGYVNVVLCKDGSKKNFSIHTLITLTFIGPRPEGQEVMHLDGNKKNPELSNLRYGSKSCNSAFTVDHGTARTNGRKLDMTRARRIREYMMVGVSIAQLARDFGVGESTIRNIRDGKNYRDRGRIRK